jgi:hypothetical protein
MTIQLAAATASISAGEVPGNRVPANPGGLPVVPFSLGCVLFGAVLERKRIPRGLVLVLALASAGVATSLLTGCGGGSANTQTQTQAGNYKVTITATSGAFQASTTITLTVE